MASAQGLSDDERSSVRSALIAELARAEEQSVSLLRQFEDIVDAAELTSTDDEHDPEGATIAFERAQVKALLSQALIDRAALQATLGRVDEQDFGTCERCGGAIGIERLIALPAAQRCVACAR
jgi:RNA polymerase-binding transcription factor DksA